MEEGAEIGQTLEDKQKSCEVPSSLDDTIQAAKIPYLAHWLATGLKKSLLVNDRLSTKKGLIRHFLLIC